MKRRQANALLLRFPSRADTRLAVRMHRMLLASLSAKPLFSKEEARRIVAFSEKNMGLKIGELSKIIATLPPPKITMDVATSSQWAKALGCSVAAIRRAVARKRLRVSYVGRTPCHNAAMIKEWLRREA